MKKILLLAACLMSFPTLAHADSKGVPTGTYVFLGTCQDHKWVTTEAPVPTGLPDCDKVSLSTDFEVSLTRGQVTRTLPSLKSPTNGRHIVGTKVRIHRVFGTSFGDGPQTFWGKVSSKK